MLAAHYRKMYDRVSELAGIGVWECDLATDALTWTDAVYDLFEIPRGIEVQRRDVVALYEPESREEMERRRAEAVRSGTGFSLDARVRTLNGKAKWIRITAEVEQEGGRSVRIFGTKQDISAEREAQEKLRTLQTELIHVSRMSAMGAMASTLAHELNQPLTAVTSYMAAARHAARGVANADSLSQCIEAAEAAALKAGEIIRRFRKLSERRSVSLTEVKLQPIVNEAIALAVAGHEMVEVTCVVPSSMSVQADAVQIQQVMLSLIRNACEACAGHATNIEISARSDGRYAEVCVTDFGPGIAADILPNMFESFVTTKPDGLGIGLSVCRTIIEAHGGRIRATNGREGGASICFTLPHSV